MSEVKLKDSRAELSLSEGEVGAATDTCIFPGIAQCFAIAGLTANSMLCTHVTPGSTKEDIDATFGYLKDIGGENVMYWYLLGPFTDHFAVTKAQWRSVQHIKKTFKANFKNKAATHMILDATQERHSKRLYPGITVPMEFSSIDIRAVRRGITMAFSYKERKRDVTAWSDFDLTKFTRM